MPVFRRRTESRTSLAMRVRVDHIRTFGHTFDTRSLSFVGGIPIFERFFLGGEFDIRGYNFRSISPVVPSDPSLDQERQGENSGSRRPEQAGSTHRRAVGPSVIRNYTFEAPEGACAGLTSPDSSRGGNTLQARRFFTPLAATLSSSITSEYRVPVFSVLSIAAFADGIQL
ncbi:MAG: BamA/TamA family outer membrane protein [Acidobacteria bacterium]|nr:BamA/TamA family outer membrane protein [Acidobacteriota bacterium]